MTVFRVHFADGVVWDVQADSPDDARRRAKHWVPEHGLIVKCKVLRQRA